jgi:hypothetical protein
MKRYVTINEYTPRSVGTIAGTATQCRGRWIPARPVNHRTLRERVKLAWQVFNGKMDVIKWDGNQ